jgi:hypothetical protein
MNTRLNRIVENTLNQLINEAPAQETDNAGVDSADSLFTPAEEKFLGKFDAYGTQHLGIIYSISDIGIREFITRSGKELNVTPGILLSLSKQGVIKFVPYTGYGRNDDYTIELQLSLNDVKGLGAEDKKNIEAGTAGGGGGATPPAEPPAMPGPENAWVVKYGDILRESVNVTRNVISEKTKKSKKTVNVIEKTRVLDELPAEFIRHMDKIVKTLDKQAKTSAQKAKIVADVLDVLQVKLNLTPAEIRKSYEFHKSQKRLQKYLDKN